ncbi:MAG: RloB domain-containing protein [Magnetococcales bacterium]|nr:RloB domain-containing protein [Magnetococcales bacterium]
MLTAGFNLAVSNPCFEVWLLCHFQPPPMQFSKCIEFENELKGGAGGSYNKSNLNIALFKGKVTKACQNAKAADIHPEDRWPQTVGTHVYRVVESIARIEKQVVC